MQTLYTLHTIQPDPLSEAISKGHKILSEKLALSLDLFTINIAYLVAVAQYAETDARFRSSKYVPTEADKNVNTKIAGNQFIWLTLDNQSYIEKMKQGNLEQSIDQNWVKKIYQQLCATSAYQQYIQEEGREAKTEKSIIRYIWTELLIKNEDFQGYLQDELNGWEDDKDMIFILMDNFFKNPSSINYLSLLGAEKLDFAKNLLRTALEKEDYCMSLIEPKLINWEADRVAQIDLTLLRMGLCEMLYFPTIPTKVTINEYIEIAKQYSTPQSGHFVNAILDKVLKDLEKEKKIDKKDRYIK